MKKIFIFYEYFPPAFKSGGITRSLTNLSKFLSEYYEVYVFSGAYDLSTKESLSVYPDTWIKFRQNISVYYAKNSLRKKDIEGLLNDIKPQVIYINGLFTPRYSFYPLLLKDELSFKAKWVIAPRGMLQQGALSVKPLKKKVYLCLIKILNLFQGLTWHATEEKEKAEIIEFGIPDRDILIASNIPSINGNLNLNLSKNKMELRMVFLALISPIKNLDKLLKILVNIPSAFSISLDIYGPIKNQVYWDQCNSIIKECPKNVNITYKGQIRPENSHKILSTYHVMSMLSKGENFGHSIFESLSVGTPVLISNKTPWKNLSDTKAGWTMDLSEPNYIQEKILEIASWDEKFYWRWRKGAHKAAELFIKENDFKSQYDELFKIN